MLITYLEHSITEVPGLISWHEEFSQIIKCRQYSFEGSTLTTILQGRKLRLRMLSAFPNKTGSK